MTLSSALPAFGWGAFSAVSLPLGALVGLWLRPSSKWTSSLMAFGGGALLAALTLELFASGLEKAGFWPLGIGTLLGTFLFMGLNAVLNNQGAFLRKKATTVDYLKEKKRDEHEEILEHLSRVDILRAMPPEELPAILEYVRVESFPAGAVVFEEGAAGDRLYLVDEGEAEVVHPDGREVARIGPGGTFGEMALLTGERRNARVRAASGLRTFTIAKGDFDRLLKTSPELQESVTRLLAERLKENVTAAPQDPARAAKIWADIAKSYVRPSSLRPSAVEIDSAHHEKGGAAMAIWLGILLDGIPESLVIGSTMIAHGHVSIALIAGVFLANFPEALSSAVGMRKQGMSFGRILGLWASLTLMTGIGAAVGYLGFGDLPHGAFAVVEGTAAGAMLAMIAETMLPEAVEQGGPAPGLMTVLGFLSAVYISTLGAAAPH